MDILKYKDWADTQKSLHMVTQMLGKVKLAKMPPQPEWGHVPLYPTAQGFTTGIIPDGDAGFDLSVNLQTSMVYAHSTAGMVAGFPLRNGAAVSDYYNDFLRMMKNAGIDAAFTPDPQEVAETRPFGEQTEKRGYDEAAAEEYFKMAIFAHNALLDFVSGFRGKKLLPALFWGTFDLTAALFEGEPAPFPGKGLIERGAFDEKMIEFGFWPGDKAVDEPSFFVLPYPFLDSLSPEGVSPCQAVFSPEKKEYFLCLKDAMSYADPHAVVVRFFRDAFAAASMAAKWENVCWL